MEGNSGHEDPLSVYMELHKGFVLPNKKEFPDCDVQLEFDKDGKVRAVVKKKATGEVVKRSDSVSLPNCYCGGEGVVEKVSTLPCLEFPNDTQIRCSKCNLTTLPAPLGTAIRFWVLSILASRILEKENE